MTQTKSRENDARASALVVTQAAKLLGGLSLFVVVVVVVLIPVIRGGPI